MMEFKIEKKDWIFLFLCLVVGIVGEEAFFRDQIGISYFAFIVIFYLLFYWRFHGYSFSHQRLGYLVLIAIWVLSAGYYLYDIILFYVLNILVIPALVIFHLVLITSPRKMEWSNLLFVLYMLKRMVEGIRYNARFTGVMAKKSKESNKPKHYEVWKKVFIGIVISVPILFVILNLLISADAQFERILSSLPQLISFRTEYVLRAIIVFVLTIGLFGFMQGLLQDSNSPAEKGADFKPITIDGIITLTVLLLLNLVYVLFIAVQFKYFFSGTLDEGLTYAEYARRGFFELLFVTLINLTVITLVISFAKGILGYVKKTINFSLTVLVLSSGILLISAFMRLTMYSDAYGFTFTRVLVYSFMLFLMVILAYTLVKIWLDKISLFHFYFIATLIYYVGINIVNLDQFVVERNMERYETMGKIDIDYLNRMSSTGVLGLIKLYEKDPQVPGLKTLLMDRKQERDYLNADSWQAHNLTRKKAYDRLDELEF
jgi:hypothetical protein